MDEEKRNLLTDEEARQEIIEKIRGFEIAQVKRLPKQQRDRILNSIKEIRGISHRQAARIIGVSPSLIDRA